jgi:hypothetical protein
VKLPKKILIPIVLFAICVGVIFIYTYATRKINGNNQMNYVNGEVLVIFNEGATYKEAVDLLKSNKLSIIENGYWKANNLNPLPDTVLHVQDIFTVKVPPGSEARVASALRQSNLVRVVDLNYVSSLQ